MGIYLHVFARFDLASGFTGKGNPSQDTGIITLSVLRFLMGYAKLGV